MDPDTLFTSIPWDSAPALEVADSVRSASSGFVAMLWTYAIVAIVVLVYALLAMARGWKSDD